MSDEENPEEKFGEGEEDEGELIPDFGEGKILDVASTADEGFQEELEEKEWGAGGEYGEDGKYFIYRPAGEAAEYSAVWEERGSVTSGETIPPSEVEETEEEKELRRQRELLIEEVRQKILQRMMLRRRNAFLQKKLVEHFKKRRMENVLKEDPKGLDLESKYLKRLYAFQQFKQAQEIEIEELNISMEQYERDTKALKEQLDERLNAFMLRAKEVSLNLILSKTGKKLSERAVERLLRRQVRKNEEKGRKKLAYIKIKTLIEERERQLREMEHIGDGLHIVDYEQMKIDNLNFSDKIEEKEEELVKMRSKTQTIMQNLAQIREKAYAVEGDIELMEEKVYEVETVITETREKLTQARKKRDTLRDECFRLKMAAGLLTKDRLLRDFEASIYEGKNLSKTLEKMKKVMLDKKRQVRQLSKLAVSTHSEIIIPLEIKPSRSQRMESRFEKIGGGIIN